MSKPPTIGTLEWEMANLPSGPTPVPMNPTAAPSDKTGMSDEPTLCTMLKSARLALNMTIEEAAKISGVSVEYIEALEADQVKRPAPHCLYFLSDVYLISYVKLMQRCGYLVRSPLSERYLKAL